MDKKVWANLALCVFLGAMFVVGVTRISAALTPRGLFVKDPAPSADAASLLPQVQLVKYNMGEDSEHMVRADFFVQNTSETDVKNLEVFCEFFDEKGTFLDLKKWLLSGTVPAGKTMQHSSVSERFINTRSKGLTCKITDFRVANASFFKLHRAEGIGHGGDAGGHDAGQAVH